MRPRDPDTCPPSPCLNGGRRLRACMALLCLVSLAACGGPGSPRTATRGPSGSPPTSPVVNVRAERITPQRFTEEFSALGTARANESIEVTSRTTSTVTRILFREGQRITAGELLIELDTRQERADVQLAEAQLRQTESQYRRSRTLAETRIVSESDIEQLAAQLEIARAQLAGAQARLDRLFIRAPFSGTIGLRKVSPGDLVGPDTQITTLDDTSIIRLEFSVPETFISELRAGMEVGARSGVYPDQVFRGKVVSIDSRVDPVTRAVAVIATIPNATGLLRPGMFLGVTLQKSRENVLLVPEESLVPREGRQFVFVVADGKASEREVIVGSRLPGLAEVREGIAADSLVITEGTQFVRDGVAVRIAQDG